MVVAVLGTGTMGAPIARHLAARAFGDVRVWNRSPERAEPLAAEGCTVTATVAEAVSAADYVVVMLADGDAVLEVLGEALPAMADGTILVQTSTVGVEATERIAALAEEHGVRLVDAPVLGTRKPAEDGKLVVLASGPEDAIASCGAIFDAIGVKTLALGDAGAGTRLKLVVNAWLVSLTEALAESIALSEALEVEPRRFLEAIGGGPIDAGYAQLKGSAMIDRSFDPAGFALALALKDARLVLDAAGAAGVAMPVVEAVAGQMKRAVEAGHGEADVAATFHATAS